MQYTLFQFTLELDREPAEEGSEESIEEDTATDDSSPGEDGSEEEGSRMPESDDADELIGDERDGAGEGAQLRISEELGDEMDEYGYSGLEQIIEDDEEDGNVSGDEDTLGPEDREDPYDMDEDATTL